jgi:hypothetical protein
VTKPSNLDLAHTCNACACSPHTEASIIVPQGKITNNLVSLHVFVVYDVSLSYLSLPYKGVVQITIDGGSKNVCWQSLNDRAKDIVCRHLGYDGVYSLVNISTPTNAKDAVFSGSINCNGEERYLSQCSINVSASESCSQLSYIECIPIGKIKLSLR